MRVSRFEIDALSQAQRVFSAFKNELLVALDINLDESNLPFTNAYIIQSLNRDPNSIRTFYD